MEIAYLRYSPRRKTEERYAQLKVAMKQIIFFFFLLYTFNSYSQTSLDLVSKPSPGVLWIGVDNVLTLTGDTMKGGIFLDSEFAEISMHNGSFIANVNSIKANTDITISAYTVISQDSTKLLSKNFHVKRIPMPTYSIKGNIIDKVISKKALLKAKKIDVILGDGFPNGENLFVLTSFDMEIDGKLFHSSSNKLSNSMIYYLTNTKSKSIRILNDKVKGFDEIRLLYEDKTFILDE